MNDPYSLAVFQGVQEWMLAHTDSHLLSWAGSQAVPARALMYLNPDAVIVGCLETQDAIAELPKVPTAGFFRSREGAHFPILTNDDLCVGRMAAGVLMEAGYDSLVALVSAAKAAHLRVQGFGEAVAASGRTLQVIHTDVPCPDADTTFIEVIQQHAEYLRTAFDQLPTNCGIFCPLNNQLADLLQHLNLGDVQKIPADLGIVLGDLPPLGFRERALTHVNLNAVAIGHELCMTLLDAVEGKCTLAPGLRGIAPLGVEVGTTIRQCARSHLLADIEKFCRPRLAEPIGVEDIARAVGLSRRVLELTLRRAHLPSPFELLTRMRLQLAERLLRDTQQSIECIAEACGFAEMRSFARWFKRYHGIPATRYRAKKKHLHKKVLRTSKNLLLSLTHWRLRRHTTNPNPNNPMSAAYVDGSGMAVAIVVASLNSSNSAICPIPPTVACIATALNRFVFATVLSKGVSSVSGLLHWSRVSLS
ncbi:MAG: helix-turn-helix domain-containing protein [Verrucomicrobia bacterium]|nr:helix-turn-helix domain-containing protein [Verrucomicrobiota bacterium]